MKTKACPCCQSGIMYRGQYGWWCRTCDTFEVSYAAVEINQLFDHLEFRRSPAARDEINRRADATRVEISEWLISQEAE